MFQRGVAALLAAAGHSVDVPDDLAGWTPRTSCSLVLLSMCEEQDWARLGLLCQSRPRLAVIALVEEELVASGVRAIQTGARTVLPRDVRAGALEHAVHVTLDGQAVMPAEVAVTLACGTSAADHGSLSAEQLQWLRHLADGMTVARLATEAGYSERAMYRLLRKLYWQLGVHNRMQAILHAQRHEWLATDAQRR